MRGLPEKWGRSLEGLLPAALALDKLHIPTRYPDALPGINPKEAYTREEAVEALAHAQALIPYGRCLREDRGLRALGPGSGILLTGRLLARWPDGGITETN